MEPLPFNLWIEQARHLLAASPDEDAWAALLAHASRCPDDVGLAYLDSHLDGWPDRLRRPNAEWRELILTSAPLPPAFALVRNLHLSGLRLRGNPARLLAARPELRQLKQLSLSSCRLGEADIDSLAPLLGGLNVLSLSSCQLGASAAGALADAALPRLDLLALDDNLLGPDGLAALLEAPWLSRVSVLSLRGNLLNQAAAEHLAAASLPKLCDLDLSGNQLNDDALLALLAAPWMPRLDALALDWNLLGDRAAARLCAAAPELSQLHSLSLNFNVIPLDTLQRLRDASWPQPDLHLALEMRRPLGPNPYS